jgi:Zn-finger protein
MVMRTGPWRPVLIPGERPHDCVRCEWHHEVKGAIEVVGEIRQGAHRLVERAEEEVVP